MRQLEKSGARGSGRKWWAFVGFSHIDCCLITDAFVPQWQLRFQISRPLVVVPEQLFDEIILVRRCMGDYPLRGFMAGWSTTSRSGPTRWHL